MKEGPSESKENKENREKKGEREASKGRAAANRKGKGGSHSRPGLLSRQILHVNLHQAQRLSLIQIHNNLCEYQML